MSNPIKPITIETIRKRTQEIEDETNRQNQEAVTKRENDARRQAQEAEQALARRRDKLKEELKKQMNDALNGAMDARKTNAVFRVKCWDADWDFAKDILTENYPNFTLQFCIDEPDLGRMLPIFVLGLMDISGGRKPDETLLSKHVVKVSW